MLFKIFSKGFTIVEKRFQYYGHDAFLFDTEKKKKKEEKSKKQERTGDADADASRYLE